MVTNCPPHLAGQTCEVDINECVKNPCRNGASCQNTNGGYRCLCQAGYTGHNCESDIDDCRPSEWCPALSPLCSGVCPLGGHRQGAPCFQMGEWLSVPTQVVSAGPDRLSSHLDPPVANRDMLEGGCHLWSTTAGLTWADQSGSGKLCRQPAQPAQPLQLAVTWGRGIRSLTRAYVMRPILHDRAALWLSQSLSGPLRGRTLTLPPSWVTAKAWRIRGPAWRHPLEGRVAETATHL